MAQAIIKIRTPLERQFLTSLLLIGLIVAGQQLATAQAMWLFQDIGVNQTTLSSVANILDHLPMAATEATAQVIEQAKETTTQQQTQSQQQTLQQSISPFSIAGIRPASIASLLNTVSDTGFSYFNVHDQCRGRTACDVGFMLYKKVNFIHNWIIRASVRSLVDHTNAYSIAWNNGMLGKNCTLIYPACSQSPLDSLMSFAFLAT